MGENLFNGIWRFRVISVTEVANKGYSVLVEFRNGSNKAISVADVGMSSDYARGYNLVLANEQTLVPGPGDPTWYFEATKIIPQGAVNRREFVFETHSDTSKPTKFLVEADPTRLPKELGLKYSVASPSFRVDLTCTK
jgi:hypothetical protein